ncbi:hypothetical protein GGS23DRAFT_600823 [Durotheca rogersii]|uniref:uncharacterized protein n=1 Tax=Durotheca rogersii TaxID=419775 RepID=UPI00221FFCD3|nr:uncharacterized protein GGS23DRAFT_600823 [Durotheca rogersii]KAI5857490.1 hypothetical protein GGS23DRAFT_600823 [Durotheca rogersii]
MPKIGESERALQEGEGFDSLLIGVVRSLVSSCVVAATANLLVFFMSGPRRPPEVVGLSSTMQFGNMALIERVRAEDSVLSAIPEAAERSYSRNKAPSFFLILSPVLSLI